MSIQIIPEVGNFLFIATVVIVVAAGVMAAAIYYSGFIRELFQ